eukprot:g5830.t1
MASSLLSQFSTQSIATVKNGNYQFLKPTKSTDRATGRPSSFIVRSGAAEKAAKKAPSPWTPPNLDPTTPSPIFGGSTGGLLQKAQVEEFYVITWDGKKEEIFEMPTGGAAIMRKGPNLLKLARKEQCLALTTQLRTKFKIEPCFYRVFPSGEVQYLHPKDGVYPEKVNEGRENANFNARRIGENSDPVSVKFTGKLGGFEFPVMSDDGDRLIIGKRCYVGNLAWKTSWQDLKDKFRECGEVVYANVMRSDDGRSKGWGIVEYESPEEAYKAVQELNGCEMNGRPLMVREDREDRDVKNYQQQNARGEHYEQSFSRNCQIVVHGIPFKFREQDLQDFFNEKVGGADHADIVMNRDGRSKGWGIVHFESPEAAQKAIDVLNDTTLEGRRIGVKLDRYA